MPPLVVEPTLQELDHSAQLLPMPKLEPEEDNENDALAEAASVKVGVCGGKTKVKPEIFVI